MEQKVDLYYLRQQISLCDSYSVKAENEHERHLFEALATFLSELSTNLEENLSITVTAD